MQVENVEGMPSEPVVEDQVEQEVQEQEEDTLAMLSEALQGLDGAPAESDLELWKSIHGQFYASSILGDDNIYIWKTLKRNEFKQIAGSGAMNEQLLYEDAVVRKCLLWPKAKPEWLVKTDAGVVPTLFKQIMHRSGFIADDIALTLIKPI